MAEMKAEVLWKKAKAYCRKNGIGYNSSVSDIGAF